MTFATSHLGKVRAKVGNDLLLVPGTRCVILNAADRVLLELRSDLAIWGLPGGNAEPAEDIATTIRREIEEETQLEVGELTPFGFASDPVRESVTFPNGHQCQFFVLLFVAQVTDDRLPVASAESLELRWFELDQLPEHMLASMRRSVEAFLAFRKTGAFQLI
jgi:ADP-ribose pyrophosphatase YjhB (NUDIX family)